MARQKDPGRSSARRGGIARDHFLTFRATDGSVLWRYLITQIAIPFGVGVAVVSTGTRLGNLADLLAGIAIVGGFLFGLVLYVFQLRRELGRKQDRQRAIRLNGFIDQLFANVLYAVAVALGVVVLMSVLLAISGEDQRLGLNPWLGAVVAALGAHLIAVIAMALVRTRRAYVELKRLG